MATLVAAPDALTPQFVPATASDTQPAAQGFDIDALEAKLKEEAKGLRQSHVSSASVILELTQQPDVEKLLAEKEVDVASLRRALAVEAAISRLEGNPLVAASIKDSDEVFMPFGFSDAQRTAMVKAAFTQQPLTAVDILQEMMKNSLEQGFLGNNFKSFEIAGVTLERIFPEAHAEVQAKREQVLAEQNGPMVAAIREGFAALEAGRNSETAPQQPGFAGRVGTRIGAVPTPG